jgi:hypothetical protein
MRAVRDIPTPLRGPEDRARFSGACGEGEVLQFETRLRRMDGASSGPRWARRPCSAPGRVRPVTGAGGFHREKTPASAYAICPGLMAHPGGRGGRSPRPAREWPRPCSSLKSRLACSSRPPRRLAELARGPPVLGAASGVHTAVRDMAYTCGPRPGRVGLCAPGAVLPEFTDARHPAQFMPGMDGLSWPPRRRYLYRLARGLHTVESTPADGRGAVVSCTRVIQSVTETAGVRPGRPARAGTGAGRRSMGSGPAAGGWWTGCPTRGAASHQGQVPVGRAASG